MRYLRLLILTIAFLLSVSFLSFASSPQAGERPVMISAPKPPYPPMALVKRVCGAVLVDVQVDAAEGKVIEANPVAGPEILRKGAQEAALRSRFKPFTASGSTYSVRLTYIFHDESESEPSEKPDFTSPYQIHVWTIVVADCFNKCKHK